MNLPISILQVVAAAGKFRALHLWCTLKSFPGVSDVVKPSLLPQIQEKAGIRDKRTLDKYLAWLQENGFVSLAPDGAVFLRSVKRILLHHQLPTSGGQEVKIPPGIEMSRAKVLELLLCWANNLYSKPYRSGALYKGTRRLRRSADQDEWGGLAGSLIASIIGRSRTTAIRVKQMLQDSKVLKQVQRFKEVPERKIGIEGLRWLRSNDPAAARGLVFCNDGIVRRQLSNKVTMRSQYEFRGRRLCRA